MKKLFGSNNSKKQAEEDVKAIDNKPGEQSKIVTPSPSEPIHETVSYGPPPNFHNDLPLIKPIPQPAIHQISPIQHSEKYGIPSDFEDEEIRQVSEYGIPSDFEDDNIVQIDFEDDNTVELVSNLTLEPSEHERKISLVEFRKELVHLGSSTYYENKYNDFKEILLRNKSEEMKLFIERVEKATTEEELFQMLQELK